MFLLASHAFLHVGEITSLVHILQLSDIIHVKDGITLKFRSCKHATGMEKQAYCLRQALDGYIWAQS